jgi:hypothetical protein
MVKKWSKNGQKMVKKWSKNEINVNNVKKAKGLILPGFLDIKGAKKREYLGLLTL